MSTPNIFDSAKSELSQDAALAYMLKWASRDHAHANRAMHNLGKDFLRALLKSTVKGFPKGEWFRKVSAKAQKGFVDVQVEVNDSICLLIEDKTDSDRHSGQIKRYVANAKKSGWKDVRPIYLKTGNESAETRKPTESICRELGGGAFYRQDLLKVLCKNTRTGDKFINDFRRHLEKWESATGGFRTTPVRKWGRLAHQGYGLALEKAKGFEIAGWGYVDNRAGGFHGLWGHSHDNKKIGCSLYWQIHDSTDLYIRCGTISGKSKISKELRHRMTDKIESCLSKVPGIHIERLRGRAGWTSNIAKIFFNKKKDGDDTYMVLQADGTFSLGRTVTRLKKVEQLIKESCK